MNMRMFPCQVKKHNCNVFLNELLVFYKNKNKLMKHFDIIAAISIPSLQVQLGKQSTRETNEKILEDVLLAKYVKRRKVKRK